MCRALKVLCAAGDPARLAELKRSAVSTSWELVGGALSLEALLRQIAEHDPDVVVFHPGFPGDVEGQALRMKPTIRIVASDLAEGKDADARREDLRAAILGLRGPGGPVVR
ncbi:hypothetical protein BH20ACT24_BH20ACT24_04770 [soil metagenome]